LYPEIIKAITTSDVQLLDSLNRMIHLGAMQQTSSFNIIQQEYIELTSFDSSNTGSALLAGFNSLFANCENHFLNISLREQVSSLQVILLSAKLDTIQKILKECMNTKAFDHDRYRRCIGHIQESYINTIIERIRIYNFQALLNTWKITEQNRQLLDTDNHLQPALNTALNNLYQAEQNLEIEEINIKLNQLELNYRNYRLELLKSFILNHIWNSPYFDQVNQLLRLNDFENDEEERNKSYHQLYPIINYKSIILQKLKHQVERMKDMLEKTEATINMFMNMEQNILCECVKLSSNSQDFILKYDHIQRLLKNWNWKNINLNAFLQNLRTLADMVTDVVDMEYERVNLSSNEEDNGSTILDMVEEWKIYQQRSSQQILLGSRVNTEQLKLQKEELKALEKDYQNVSGKFSLLVNSWLAHLRMIQKDSGNKYENILRELSNLIESISKISLSARIQHLEEQKQEWWALYSRIVNHLRQFEDFLAKLDQQQLKLLNNNQQSQKKEDMNQEENIIDLINVQSVDQIFSLEIQQEYDTACKEYQETNKYIIKKLNTMCIHIQSIMTGSSISGKEESDITKLEEVEEQPTTEDIKLTASTTTSESDTMIVSGKRNTYAMDVLKRVQERLEDERSVPEQVQAAIEQATNIDNLCSMYEGWCPFC
jgi:hypothetical protein